MTDPVDGLPPRAPRVGRRGVIAAALAAPLVAAVGIASRRTGEGAVWLRPPARATTAAVCAQCGRPGHTMLSRGCPVRPEVTR